MKIILSPKRLDSVLQLVKSGDNLIVNDEKFDFSLVGEGDTLPREAIHSLWFDGPVDRIDGELVLTVVIPNPWNFSYEQAFPVPIDDVPDGPVMLPGPRAETDASVVGEINA
ncbi:hypothetical protein YA0783_25415 [Pseudomonas corrugata]|uniref:hypothetical protein n=1 Tax=Pseudomonas corrugata TaxID=47879 RepID=UPI0018E5CFAD|nr:hypothetical protein [Pseudomonas corrugata]MBI6621632.1 hypothetical protein [Pseudomonas corrugata]MBI6695826.1 hypothetical protein [Pseudomonas corrugata]